MGKSLFVLLGILLFTVTGKALCVQSFNVYGPIYATHVSFRTYLMMEHLMSENTPCEVIQLQEVWSSRQEAQIERHLKSDYQIAKPKFTDSGLLSLSTLPAYKSEHHEFHLNYDDGILDRIRSAVNIKKGFHAIQVEYAKEPLWIVNTHLHPTSSSIRLTQIIDLALWRKSNSEHKVIFTGDFNANVMSIEWRIITSFLGWIDGVEQGLGFYPSYFCTYCKSNHRSWKNEDEILDYIFISNNPQNSRVELFVKSAIRNLTGSPDFTWSDHFGIRAQVSHRTIREGFLKKIQIEKDALRLAAFREAEQILLKSKDPQVREYAEKLKGLL